MLRNPIVSRHRCGPLICGISGAYPLLLLLVTLASAIPLVTAGRSIALPAGPPPPAGVQVVLHAEGLDRSGRKLPFTLYILTEETSWRFASVTDLEDRHRLLSPELTAAVSRAQEVLCIGTASSEGHLPREEQRSARRARTLAAWIGTAICERSRTRLFALDAGQYVGPAGRSTTVQALLHYYSRSAVLFDHLEEVRPDVGTQPGPLSKPPFGKSGNKNRRIDD